MSVACGTDAAFCVFDDGTNAATVRLQVNEFRFDAPPCVGFVVAEEESCDIREFFDPEAKEIIQTLAEIEEAKEGTSVGGAYRTRRGQTGGGIVNRVKNIWRGICALTSALRTQRELEGDLASAVVSAKMSAIAGDSEKLRELNASIREKIALVVGSITTGLAMRNLAKGVNGSWIYWLITSSLETIQSLVPSVRESISASTTFAAVAGSAASGLLQIAAGMGISVLSYRFIRASLTRMRARGAAFKEADRVDQLKK